MPFTIVFDGDIRDLDRNPFKIESKFGKVIASGMGNAFDIVLAMEDVYDAAQKLIAEIDAQTKKANEV